MVISSFGILSTWGKRTVALTNRTLTIQGEDSGVVKSTHVLRTGTEIVADVAENVSTALSAVVADYSGLTVNEMTSLRKQARESGVYLRVVRNNLARLAIKGSSLECLSDILVGPLLLALSKDEPGAAAKLFKNFQKDFYPSS